MFADSLQLVFMTLIFRTRVLKQELIQSFGKQELLLFENQACYIYPIY